MDLGQPLEGDEVQVGHGELVSGVGNLDPVHNDVPSECWRASSVE